MRFPLLLSLSFFSLTFLLSVPCHFSRVYFGRAYKRRPHSSFRNFFFHISIVCCFQWFLMQRKEKKEVQPMGYKMYRKSIFPIRLCFYHFCRMNSCCRCRSFLFVYFCTISVEFLCNKNGVFCPFALIESLSGLNSTTNRTIGDFSPRLSVYTNNTPYCVVFLKQE